MIHLGEWNYLGNTVLHQKWTTLKHDYYRS